MDASELSISYSDDEELVTDEATGLWEEKDVYVETFTNDRSWVLQRSLNDGESLAKDKVPDDANFVQSSDGDSITATALRLQNNFDSNHNLIGMDLVEEPCLMSNLRPGMIVKVMHGNELPADVIPIAIGHPQGQRQVMYADTKRYDGVKNHFVIPSFLIDDVITHDDQLKNYRFYGRAQASSFALATFKGAVTWGQEDERALVNTRTNVYKSEQEGAALGKSSGLTGEMKRKELSKENLVCYRSILQVADEDTVLYGLCVYTGDNTKYMKWKAEDDKKSGLSNARSHGGRDRRPRFQKAKKVNVGTEATKTQHTTKKHEIPTRRKARGEDEESSLSDEDEDDSPVKLLPTKSEEKRKKIWIAIIVTIVVVCGAIAGIVIGVVGVGGSDGSVSAPGTISITSGTTSAKGTSAYLVFNQPANNGASISSYTCTATPSSGSAVTASGTATCTTAGVCTFTCTGLAKSVTYGITMLATNSAGSGTASSAVSVSTVDQQNLALKKLFESTAGALWSQQSCPQATNAGDRTPGQYTVNKNWCTSGCSASTTSFNDGGDYCATSTTLTDGTGFWSGVACTDGFVTELSLNGYGLSGTLPTELGYLTALTTFNVGMNPNPGVLSTGAVSNHQSLEGKDTTATSTCQMVNHVTGTAQAIGLVGSLPTELGKLTNLKTFDASNTFISGTIPTEFSGLSSLVEFKVSKTQDYCKKSGTTNSAMNSETCATTNSFTYASDPFYSQLIAMKDSVTDICLTEQDDESTAAAAAGSGILPCGN
jgi:hypothetical protein